jgi:hypothetical protein
VFLEKSRGGLRHCKRQRLIGAVKSYDFHDSDVVVWASCTAIESSLMVRGATKVCIVCRNGWERKRKHVRIYDLGPVLEL